MLKREQKAIRKAKQRRDRHLEAQGADELDFLLNLDPLDIPLPKKLDLQKKTEFVAAYQDKFLVGKSGTWVKQVLIKKGWKVDKILADGVN